MEHALGGSHWNFSADFNIDGEIDFSGQSWALNVNNTNSLDSFDASARLNDVNKILGLAWLTNKDNGLFRNNITFQKLSWVIEGNFLESF